MTRPRGKCTGGTRYGGDSSPAVDMAMRGKDAGPAWKVYRGGGESVEAKRLDDGDLNQSKDDLPDPLTICNEMLTNLEEAMRGLRKLQRHLHECYK